VAALGALAWMLGQLRELRTKVSTQETALLSLRGALSALCADERLADQRQSRLERQLRQVGEQQELLLLRDPEAGPYRQAMRLARKGASSEDLIATCGLTRGEADLLLAVHAKPESRADQRIEA
jgi:hypothetical protein